MKQIAWEDEQTNFVIEKHKELTVIEIAQQLDRTYNQVNSKIQRLRKTRPMEMDKSKWEVQSKGIFEVPRQTYLTYSQIKKVKYKRNIKYQVELKGDARNKLENQFIGTLVQETKNHITLRCELGYCQSFLKVDLIRGENPIKEVE